jgi:hypothetical protein
MAEFCLICIPELISSLVTHFKYILNKMKYFLSFFSLRIMHNSFSSSSTSVGFIGNCILSLVR